MFREKLKKLTRYNYFKKLYEKHERVLIPSMLVFGVVVDFETLEISNISKSPIKIYPGMRIVKAVFIKLSHESAKAYAENGKYAGQTEGKAILGK